MKHKVYQPDNIPESKQKFVPEGFEKVPVKELYINLKTGIIKILGEPFSEDFNQSEKESDHSCDEMGCSFTGHHVLITGQILRPSALIKCQIQCDYTKEFKRLIERNKKYFLLFPNILINVIEDDNYLITNIIATDPRIYRYNVLSEQYYLNIKTDRYLSPRNYFKQIKKSWNEKVKFYLR